MLGVLGQLSLGVAIVEESHCMYSQASGSRTVNSVEQYAIHRRARQRSFVKPKGILLYRLS